MSYVWRFIAESFTLSVWASFGVFGAQRLFALSWQAKHRHVSLTSRRRRCESAIFAQRYSGAASSLDSNAGLARSGFVFGLISAVVTLFASLNFWFSLFFYDLSLKLPDLSSGEVVLLFIAMTSVAMIGMTLCVAGWRSTTRHRQAVAGVAFSAFALVPFFLAVLIIISWNICQPSCV